jgi:hypothetical protein
MTTATKPRTSSNKEVHRDLHLVSPLLQGPDVHELQEAINALANHYEFPWRSVHVDGDYGRRTARGARFAAWLIGLDDERLHAITTGRITEKVQHILRNPEDRSKEDRRREDQRQAKRVKLRKEHSEGMPAAVKFMLDHVGIHEEPADSNHGPFPIDDCQKFFGLSGVPWCGCLAGFSIKKVGGIDSLCWFPYAGSIREDAIAGRNGLHDVRWQDADVGCVATFFSGGDDHVGLIRGKSDVDRGILFTVEGNTSSAVRDSDGGIIEKKERSTAELTIVARVAG